MSSSSETPRPSPPRPRPPPPPPRGGAGWFFGCAFALSFLANIFGLLLIVVLCASLMAKTGLSEDTTQTPLEKYHSGNKSAANKVAIVSLETIIFEGYLTSVHKQIEQAAKDENVKAVVLRINSPGGSITASDDLHRRIIRLRDGDPDKSISPRPLVVSMGSVAASGGYFVAVPAKTILAERSTITGSIGVYASFPNATELAGNVGFTMNTIKAGEIKDSGSPFKEMSPKEHEVWQDMVNDAYDQFLTVVEQGRPVLTRAKLLQRFEVKPLQPDPQVKNPAPYSRYRADGGIYTAPKARELQLIDEIGDLDDAVKAAAKLAQLTDYKAIKYEKRSLFTDILLNSRAEPAGGSVLDVNRWKAALSPRVWYLASGYEAAGLLTAPNP
jgi:protease-4